MIQQLATNSSNSSQILSSIPKTRDESRIKFSSKCLSVEWRKKKREGNARMKGASLGEIASLPPGGEITLNFALTKHSRLTTIEK